MTNQPPKKTRRQALEEIVAAQPADAFARYGLALDFMNAGEGAAADGHFRKLIELNPAYVPAYLMYAQLLIRESRSEDARQILQSGIAAAIAAGNSHARSELEGLLAELP
ncbi:MAG: tetratricopeptide repeat protein [Acidobacteriia bacterium]|nr:tetratricopeptide repeat protein [Terriglobia bacterium]